MHVTMRLGMIAAIAAATIGCNQTTDANSRQSVTVKLKPPRPYKPEPGFSLATDLPAASATPADAKASPHS